MGTRTLSGILATLLIMPGGCATRAGGVGAAAGGRALEVRPEWRQFALDQYPEMVRHRLNTPDLAFRDSLAVSASYDPREDLTHLTAAGTFDARNAEGRTVTGTATVDWAAAGDLSRRPPGAAFGPVHRAAVAAERPWQAGAAPAR
jgi:hypothetical protein